MFKYSAKRHVLWPVKISEPSEDGSGKTHERKAKVLFELLDSDDARDIEENPSKGRAVLAEKIKGWEGIEGEDGKPLEYSHEMTEALIKLPYVERAFSIGLLQASNGAPVKN